MGMLRSGNRFPFTAELIAGAPEHAGVYALWQHDEVIYIGRALGGAATIRSRLVDHFSGREGACTRATTHYQWQIARDPAARERQLLEEHQALFRRQPRCNRA